MGLETGVNYIADLVATNPAIGDEISVGDDHIRNVKRALQASFPKMAGIFKNIVASASASFSISSTLNHAVYVNSYSGGSSVTLPAAATVGPGFVVTIVNGNSAGLNAISVALTGLDAFVSSSSPASILYGAFATFISDGVSKWLDLGGDSQFYYGYYRGLADSALQQGLHSIWLPIKSAIVPASGYPALGQVTGSNGMVLDHYAFDKDGIETLQWSAVLPRSHNSGGYALAPWITLKAEIFYSSTAVGGCTWGASASVHGGSLAWDIAFGTEISGTTSMSGANYIGRQFLANIQPAGTPVSLFGKMLQFRLRRLATDANDTLAADALLHGVRLYYNVHANVDNPG